MGPDTGARLVGESGEIRSVDNQGGEVGQGVHGRVDEGPAELRARDLGALVDDGASSVGLDEGPHQEGDTGDWTEDGLDGEQVANNVGRKIDEGKLEEPVEEETQHLEGGDVARERVVDLGVEVVAEDGPEHQLDTVTADGRLHTEPDARHHNSVDDGPHRPPDAERRSARHGEGDVVGISHPGGRRHKAPAEEVPDPHRDPGDPPREPCLHACGGDLPRVDVERVGDPEEDKVVPVPLSAGLFDGPQVVVEQEELREREALCALDFKRLQPPPEPGLPVHLLAVVAVAVVVVVDLDVDVTALACAHERRVPGRRPGRRPAHCADLCCHLAAAAVASFVQIP